MKHRSKRKAVRPKTELYLPDLEQAKAAVVGSLASPGSQREYRHAIDQFVAWYCSEPRLSFSKTVVTRFRTHLEERKLAPATINVRLAAVRRLAYEAADSDLLTPDLAAGIRRVKGAKKLGLRLGNWLTQDEARTPWQSPDPATLKGSRDRAMLATLLGCGLRRRELADLGFVHIQRREDHWAIVDLIGKGGHVRTVPMSQWVKNEIDEWCRRAGATTGKIFRCVCRAGKTWGDSISEQTVWHVVRTYAARLGLGWIAPHDLRRSCARLCHVAGGELEQIQFLLGHVSVQTTVGVHGATIWLAASHDDGATFQPSVTVTYNSTRGLELERIYASGAGGVQVWSINNANPNTPNPAGLLNSSNDGGGPRYYVLNKKTWGEQPVHAPAPFVQVLIGGAHASGTLSGTRSGSSNGFAFTAGGGLDVGINRHMVARLFQTEYLFTHIPNGGNDHQNNFRLSTGLVTRF